MSETNSLVYFQDSQIVTDSKVLASTFEKGHDKVLRDIRQLEQKCSKEFYITNFGETKYKNKQGRLMPKYIITQDGFAMLAMGYTGKESMQFKERYIKEFNRMRSILESQQTNSNNTQLLEEFKCQITIKSKQQKEIQVNIRRRIHSLYSHVRDSGRRKYYSKIYQDLKTKFLVDSFRDIRVSDYEEAIKFIDEWESPKLVNVKGGVTYDRTC
ncbi:Rha family transcriptional regulator [Evansella sp. AB-P1]|uniref:Rha family transcriptional regulator n=1 Tax=Evansella sp. AB-P1 TaxID=3037653 RepID=UPI00241C4DF0|nr:Rha family transcriptional regulator [Evansella sp. AB-P1]MDG5787799.1 Rha family transcriptional regulator [Evansella sp. AB-P1]